MAAARDERDRAGVQAAGEVAPDRHIADELTRHRPLERGADALDPLLRRDTDSSGSKLEVPVARRTGRALILADPEEVSGRQHPDPVEQRRVGEDVLEGEVLRQAGGRHLRAVAGRDQRLHLGAEGERPTDRGVVQRLDPEPVASDEELALVGVPDREREHAVEAVEAGRAPLLVGAKHDLRVGPGLERVPAVCQLAPQALGSCRARRCRRSRSAPSAERHRLVAGRRGVDHRKSHVGEADAARRRRRRSRRVLDA